MAPNPEICIKNYKYSPPLSQDIVCQPRINERWPCGGRNDWPSAPVSARRSDVSLSSEAVGKAWVRSLRFCQRLCDSASLTLSVLICKIGMMGPFASMGRVNAVMVFGIESSGCGRAVVFRGDSQHLLLVPSPSPQWGQRTQRHPPGAVESLIRCLTVERRSRTGSGMGGQAVKERPSFPAP